MFSRERRFCLIDFLSYLNICTYLKNIPSMNKTVTCFGTKGVLFVFGYPGLFSKKQVNLCQWMIEFMKKHLLKDLEGIMRKHTFKIRMRLSLANQIEHWQLILRDSFIYSDICQIIVEGLLCAIFHSMC